MTVVKASQVEPRGVDWLWREHIPYGMIVTVAGRPDVGKSMFCMHIASELSHDAPVIYSTVEDPLHEVVRPRLEAAGANLDNVHLWKDGMSLPRDCDKLRAYIEEHGIVLCVLDSIAAQLGVSMANDQATKRALAPVRALAEDTDCAFIFLHHVRKGVTKSMTALDAVGGSGGGLNAVSRITYIFGQSPNDQDERGVAQAKCNIASRRTPLTFEIDTESYYIKEVAYDSAFLVCTGEAEKKMTAERLLLTKPEDVIAVEKMEAVADCAEWLCTYLSRGPRDMKATTRAARGAGYTGIKLRRVAERLKIEKEGRMWALPEGLEALLMTDVPTYMEPTVGVRAWRWDSDRKRLVSLTNDQVWEPGEPLTASCRHDSAGSPESPTHMVPAARCHCGIYAVRSLSILRDQDYHNDGVLGLVQLWGRIMVGAKGYRAAQAYPLKLYVPHLMWDAAEQGLLEYKVPITLINPFRAELNPEEGVT